MAGNPFDQFDEAPATPIYGAPDPTMPFKVEDQILQRRGDARAAASEQRSAVDQQMQIENAQRQRLEWNATHNEDGTPKLTAKDMMGTVEQGKAAGFLRRALNANDVYEAQKIGPRSLVGQALSERAPSLLNSLPEAVGNSPERQVADVNQDDFIAATLRYESGAAIPPAEADAQRRRYFPMPGDSEEAVAAKAALRKQAIEALKLSAGPSAQTVYDEFTRNPDGSDDSDGITGTVTDDSPAPPSVPPTAPGGGGNGGLPGGGLLDLAQQGVTLGLADEAAGVGGYISGFLTGEDPQAAYIRERDAARGRVAAARKQYPIMGTAAEFLGGGGAARIAAPVGNALGAVVRQGAALGGAAGYGYGEGAQGSVTNALAGAAGGAALGGALYGAGRGVSSLANRSAGVPPTSEQLALIQAGERQGVPVRQPDVRPELRNRMANAETTQTGGPMIREARAQDANLIEQRVGAVGGQGNASDPYALGTRVQEAGRRYIANTRTQANGLYDRARRAAGDARVQPTEALAAVDQNIAELRAAGENSNSGQIAYLEGLRQDLSNPLSIEAVQNLRTNMRGQLSERGLTGTDAERRVSQVIDAANQDLTRELPQGASDALRAADTFYRERQTFINDTLNQIMGTRGNPLPAETAASRLVSMTKGGGNYRRFSSMWQQLEDTERADVAATVAESLGRKRNGEFSISTLVQSLDPSKGINPRTARLIFGDDGAAALSDLRLLAKTKTDVQASLNNSRTGTAVNAASGGLKNLLLSGLGFSTGGVGGAVVAPVAGRIIANLGEKRAARMLLNPDFTKWLKNAPNTTSPQVIDKYFTRLTNAAGAGARNPGVSSIAVNDNQAFVAAVRDAFSRSPGVAAADEQDRRREPPQQ